MSVLMYDRKIDIISINDLQNSEIEEIFQLADRYSNEMAAAETPFKIRGSREDANRFILATLFYEPSTRTRFSFESAMLRLGGSVLASSDPATTSASKGESLADTVRVIENYADLIVLRHPKEGAARAAADYVDIPIINGGDGSHEHPTQTLCDLYTLRRENKSIRGLNVLLVGDLKNGRTVHSLVYALARFGANIVTMPAEGLELPIEVHDRLEHEFNCTPMSNKQARDALGADADQAAIGAVYIASSETPQLRLLGDDELNLRDAQKKLRNKIDVCYVTRPQKERFTPADQNHAEYPVVNRDFLKGNRYADARVLHPLPRVNELDYELDSDRRGVYFKQAGYGVPIRMALIAKILGIEPFKSVRTQARRADQILEQHDGMICPNERCITHAEQRYLPSKTIVIHERPLVLRCLYCETTIPIRFVGRRTDRTYVARTDLGRSTNLQRAVVFSSEEQARGRGYRPRQKVQKRA
jgi:aspartate carbamoyltransferase catalytic subunit